MTLSSFVFGVALVRLSLMLNGVDGLDAPLLWRNWSTVRPSLAKNFLSKARTFSTTPPSKVGLDRRPPESEMTNSDGLRLSCK